MCAHIAHTAHTAHTAHIITVFVSDIWDLPSGFIIARIRCAGTSFAFFFALLGFFFYTIFVVFLAWSLWFLS